MSLIKLNITHRGTGINVNPLSGGPALYGFDVDDIVSPIRNINGSSYFTARTNKDGANNNLNGSKLQYRSSDSLATIQAQSNQLILLTVVSRRGVQIANENYVFVSRHISENLVPSTLGTRFFYMEDGDPLPVEYIVSQTVSQIVSQSAPAPGSSMIIQDRQANMPTEPKLNFVGFNLSDNTSNGSTDITNIRQITYSALMALSTANNIPIGAFFLITDRGDQGIIVQAVGANKIARRAIRIMNCPLFYGIGPSGGGGLFWKGVWNPSIIVSVGDRVIWGGKVWISNTGTAGTATNPTTLDSTNWTLVPKPTFGTTSPSYSVLRFNIFYDFANDWIEKQYDGAGNVVGVNFYLATDLGLTFNPVDVTDWNLTSANYYLNDNNCPLGIYNNTSTAIQYNITNEDAISTNITREILKNNCSWIKNNSCDTIHKNYCSAIQGNTNVTFAISENILGDKNITGNSNGGAIVRNSKKVGDIVNIAGNGQLADDNLYSGSASNYFEIDITGLTTLNLGSFSNYIGIVYLKSTNATESINTITNMPSRNVIFNVKLGLSVTFVHGTGTNQPRCEGATNAVINGTNSDWIEFEKYNTVIRQKNIGTY